MLKTTERNRRQAICASLIASTIVTADCGDEECACATTQDADGAASTASPANDHAAAQNEMPIGDGVSYSLAPVITSLPTDRKIAVASLPADLAIEDVLVDAVSPPDQLVDLDGADENTPSPKLTRAKRRSASNQNRSSRWGLSEGEGAESLITEEVIALPETDQFDVQLQVGEASPPKERSLSKRPLLQDDYVAFGVNGR